MLFEVQKYREREADVPPGVGSVGTLGLQGPARAVAARAAATNDLQNIVKNM